MNKSTLIEKMAELVREGKLDEISDLRDESDRTGMRIVIELKRGAAPKKVRNKLFKHTQLQAAFGVNTLALVDNEPVTLSLRRSLIVYVEHRVEVLTRRTQFQLARARERAHILEGLRIALQFLDEVIALIRAADSAEAARTGLDGALRSQPGAGAGHPRPAVAPPGGPGTPEDRGRVRRDHGEDRVL